MRRTMAEPDFYRHFGGMCWPAQSERLGDVTHALVWGDPPSKTDRLLAASVLNAYAELIRLTEKKRNAIIRELRKGPGIVRTAQAESNPPIIDKEAGNAP